MKIAVIGAGSIGSRHTRILQNLNHEVVIVSRHVDSQLGTVKYKSISDALKNEQFEYVVVASKTSQHINDLNELCSTKFAGRVLIEKPLFASSQRVARNNFEFAGVGYNLRFHPAVLWLQDVLPQLGKISSANFYVGQYLPTWRDNNDYRASSSAKATSGGGVLRDLSHEIDLAQYFFDDWTHLTACGGKFSNLEIETDDTFSILMKTKICSALSIQLNYLDRIKQRNITINGDNGTINVDLIAGTTQFNETTQPFKLEPDQTYLAEHTAMIEKDATTLCTFDEALAVVETIGAIEKASEKQKWVNR